MEEEKQEKIKQEAPAPVKTYSQEEYDKIIAERDKMKRERDEANATLTSMSTSKKADERDEFEALFKGEI